jgi:mono/diheme cytochrome c family protein
MNSLWQNARNFRFVVLLPLVLSLFSTLSLRAQDGKALFKANCASCHYASSKKGTGPGLMGALERIPGGDWKYKWVKNSTALIASGDAYANKIFLENNKSVMSALPALTEKEVDAILAYANPGPDEKKAGPAAAGPGAAGTEVTLNEGKGSVGTTALAVIILAIIIVLIAVLRYAKINLRNAVNTNEGQPEEPGLPFIESAKVWINNNKKIVLVIGLFLMGVLVVKGWYSLKGIGVYAHEVKPGKWVGYKPEQPINFSHKIHAGDNGIDCQYCHSTVEKSKTASIPSANVCMNCHRVIDQTANEGSKEEIAKIYYAVGWNADSAKYTGITHPIKWNKVHVLPDHVFFSHQQHVKVGKQECETCHGNLKTMTVAEQQRPLTMGWCIDCHRTTQIDMKEDEKGNYAGNGYYESLHEKMKEKYGKGAKITVAQAGGIECARCHY